MARKEFMYKGHKLESLKSMKVEQFIEIAPARIRRSLKRGLSPRHKKLLARFRKDSGKTHRTHCRDMPILPEFIGKAFAIHNGKEFVNIKIEPEMIGHYLGEFVLTRKRVQHSSPGMGATRASKYVALK